jgi:hypothetical protein
LCPARQPDGFWKKIGIPRWRSGFQKELNAEC